MLQRGRQAGQSGDQVTVQVEADHTAPRLVERPAVTQGLGRAQHAKGQGRLGRAGLVGDTGVAAVVRQELDEQAVAGITLVQLAGGVQKARAIAHGSGQVIVVTQCQPQRLQGGLGGRVGGHVGL